MTKTLITALLFSAALFAQDTALQIDPS